MCTYILHLSQKPIPIQYTLLPASSGSYAALDGNNPSVGLAMLTGQPVLSFGTKDQGATWIKKDVVFNSNQLGKSLGLLKSFSTATNWVVLGLLK